MMSPSGPVAVAGAAAPLIHTVKAATELAASPHRLSSSLAHAFLEFSLAEDFGLWIFN